MSETGVLAPKFDAVDPALAEDPYAVYASLRAGGRVCRGAPGQWVLPHYEDVAALLRDRRLTKCLPEPYFLVRASSSELTAFLMRMNDRHRTGRMHRLLGRLFGTFDVTELIGGLRPLVDRLLEPARETGAFDVVADLATPFPLLVMCRLLGLPVDEPEGVGPLASDLTAAFTAPAFESERNTFIGGAVSGDGGEASVAALRRLDERFSALVAERRKRPRDDLASLLVAAEVEGERLGDEEVVDNLVTLLYAGFETSKGMIANGLAALLEHPDELARLRADRSLLPSAVDEVLRYDTTIQVVMRTPLEPLDVAGRTVRPGRVLVLLLGSANRDERKFDGADRLDISRRPNPHVGFGGGLYACLGASVARAEGVAVFGALLDAFASFELAGPPQRPPTLTFRTFERLPLAVTAT